jgi:hypothetical protein
MKNKSGELKIIENRILHLKDILNKKTDRTDPTKILRELSELYKKRNEICQLSSS